MRDLVVVQLNDLHGYLESHCGWFWGAKGFEYRNAGGIARIKTVLDTLRLQYGNILVCDNGDTLHGTRPVVATQGACLVPILNRLGLAAMTGHWDFAYGPEVLKKRVNELDYPFLAANVYHISDGSLVFPPCRRISVGSLRVGIIGLDCNIVDKTMPPHFSEGMLVEDAMRPFDPQLQMQVGITPIDLNRATMLESTSDNLVLDAMLQATDTELAFANGWRYGAPISAGKITLSDLYNLAPMDPEIMTVQLTGGEIWKMIEQNLERTFSRDAFGQMGGYVKRCAGMTTFFKVENPAGSRVQSIFVGRSPIALTRTYHAAYITVQAVPDGFGTERVHTGIHLIDALEQFLEHNARSPMRGSFVEV